MNKDRLLSQLKGGCIVSCQALEDEPLYGSNFMASMAVAAEQGGAVAIRANTPADIRAIKEKCGLPVIGLYKKHYPGADAYITPTINEVTEIIQSGADLIAIDATKMSRPNNESLQALMENIRKQFKDACIVADISTYDEGILAAELGADLVSTTMSGYTPYSPQQSGPDIELVRKLSQQLTIPVIAEGRIWTPEECVESFNAGAYTVVVGTAITRPKEITKRFVSAIQANRSADKERNSNHGASS